MYHTEIAPSLYCQYLGKFSMTNFPKTIHPPCLISFSAERPSTCNIVHDPKLNLQRFCKGNTMWLEKRYLGKGEKKGPEKTECNVGGVAL